MYLYERIDYDLAVWLADGVVFMPLEGKILLCDHIGHFFPALTL